MHNHNNKNARSSPVSSTSASNNDNQQPTTSAEQDDIFNPKSRKNRTSVLKRHLTGLNNLVAELEKLGNKYDERMETIGVLKSHIQELKDQLKEKEQELKSKNDLMDQKQEMIEEKQEIITSQEKEIKELKEKISLLEEILNVGEEGLKEKDMKILELEKQTSDLKEETSDLKNKTTEVKNALEKNNKTIAEQNETIAEQNVRIKTSNAANTLFGLTIKDLEEKNRRLEEENRRLKMENEKLKGGRKRSYEDVREVKYREDDSNTAGDDTVAAKKQRVVIFSKDKHQNDVKNIYRVSYKGKSSIKNHKDQMCIKIKTNDLEFLELAMKVYLSSLKAMIAISLKRKQTEEKGILKEGSFAKIKAHGWNDGGYLKKYFLYDTVNLEDFNKYSVDAKSDFQDGEMIGELRVLLPDPQSKAVDVVRNSLVRHGKDTCKNCNGVNHSIELFDVKSVFLDKNTGDDVTTECNELKKLFEEIIKSHGDKQHQVNEFLVM